MVCLLFFFFFSSRRRHTRYWRDWSSDVCSSDLVAFTSDATNLGSPSSPAGPVEQVYVRDVRRKTTHPASVNAQGTPGNRRSSRPALSVDGHRVAFDSAADNLVPDDQNGAPDVFVRETVRPRGR